MMNNIIILEKPERVNIMDWTLDHLGCDALIIKQEDNAETMDLRAYALNENGNKELNRLPFAFNSDVEYFKGLDEAMLNHLGGII